MARRTFGRFPGPDDGERVPDGTTIRRLPEAPVRTGAVEKPFARSDVHPGDAGYPAMGGQTVDATIVAVPRQRMTDAGKEIVRGGGIPADWQANPRKPAQKDRDARWTLGRGRGKTRPDGTAMVAIATPVFGCKSRINADRRHGLVRTWTVTAAARHDGRVPGGLADQASTGATVRAGGHGVSVAEGREESRPGRAGPEGPFPPPAGKADARASREGQCRPVEDPVRD